MRASADAAGPVPAAQRAIANVVGVLWAAAMFAWFFISALYMQLVLGYDPMQIGLAFLPANVIMAVFSHRLSAKLVMRYGIRRPLVGGMLLAAAGLALFACRRWTAISGARAARAWCCWAWAAAWRSTRCCSPR